MTKTSGTAAARAAGELSEANAAVEELGASMADVLQLIWLANVDAIEGLVQRLGHLARERRRAIARAARLTLEASVQPAGG